MATKISSMVTRDVCLLGGKVWLYGRHRGALLTGILWRRVWTALRWQGVLELCRCWLVRPCIRPVGAAIHAPLAIIGPHISQSFELMRHIPSLIEREDYRSTAEMSPNALFFLDRKGRLVHANRPGRTLHSEASIVRVDRDGHFHLHDPQAERALHAALGAIARADFQKLRGNFLISRTNGLPVEATIAPIERNATLLIFDQIFENLPIATLVLKSQPDAATLLEGCGLTPAELALAQSIAKGLSPRELADSKGISINAVRTQQKAVYSKTGTTRQSQLVH